MELSKSTKRTLVLLAVSVFLIPAIRLVSPSCFAQSTAQSAKASLPWMNTALPPDERADLVVAQMTLDEKIQLVHSTG